MVQDRQVTWCMWAFEVGLVVWVVASALLGIPHGPGHSIESMTPLQTIRDIAFPLWVGGLAGIAGLLALRTLGARSNYDRVS